MAFLLDRHAAFPIGKVPRIEMWQDGLLEHFPHILRSNVKALLDLADFDLLLLHLLVVLADLSQHDLILVEEAVLADLPEGNRSDRINPHIQLRCLDYPLTHLNHRTFFIHSDLALPANPDDHMLGFHDRHEVYLELDGLIHFLDELLPVLEGEVDHLSDVELFEVVLLLETGRIYSIACHVLDRQDVLMLLSFLLLALFGEFLPELVTFLSAVVLLLDLVHNPEDGQESSSCDITDILVEFEHEAAIRYDLPSLLE